MKFNQFNIIYFFVAICLLTACSTSPKVPADQLDNYYFVKVGDIALPVRVCGNINADIAIVYVHGGPGGSAQGERANKYWEEIENLLRPTRFWYYARKCTRRRYDDRAV